MGDVVVTSNIGRFDWSDFSSIDNSSDLENYIKYTKPNDKNQKYENLRAYNHSRFFHYSKLEKIEKILSSKCILLTNPGSSNDPIEENIKDKKYKFITCFSTGKNENIPLWYLYGGVNGCGGCLSFSKSQIYDIIKNGKYSLVEKKDGKIVENSDIALSEDEYECKIQDIVYYKSNGNFVTLKYNNMTNNENMTCVDFEIFKETNSEFVKSLAWYYEKETRLMVELNVDIIKTLDENKSYALKISFAELESTYKKFKIILGPQTTTKSDLIFGGKYPAISEHLFKSSNVSDSDLKDQVKIDLCKDCDKNYKKL